MKRLAYVVSSHGFGHAARACAVVEALWREPAGRDVHVTFFGRTPDWFFRQSLRDQSLRDQSLRDQSLGPPGPWGSYDLVAVDTDVGLVQTTSLREDPAATAEVLLGRLPFEEAALPLVRALEGAGGGDGFDAVVCDISPWGLAAAHRLDLPSLLVENFTWDWIYAGYPELRDLALTFRDAFALASRRVQTQPVCRTDPDAACVTHPVSRSARRPSEEVRAALGVEPEETLVMMTMGGVAWSYEHLDALEAEKDRVWVIAGGATGPESERRGRHLLLPHRSPLYHPDLVAASDVVVGKLGYSTVAEVAAAGTRFVYVPRPHFPESQELEDWTRRHLMSRHLPPAELESADWFASVRHRVKDIEAETRTSPTPQGAGLVARTILEL